MVQTSDSRTSHAAPPEFVGPLSVRTLLQFLEPNDLFEFVDEEVREGKAPPVRLPKGKLRITIKPWGPHTPTAGPIGPWMFACRNEVGVEQHFALPPRLDVRLLQRAKQ